MEEKGKFEELTVGHGKDGNYGIAVTADGNKEIIDLGKITLGEAYEMVAGCSGGLDEKAPLWAKSGATEKFLERLGEKGLPISSREILGGEDRIR